MYVITRSLLGVDASQEKIRAFKEQFPVLLEHEYPHIITTLPVTGELDVAVKQDIRDAFRRWEAQYEAMGA